jgi:PAS domain S-box-containing protein
MFANPTELPSLLPSWHVPGLVLLSIVVAVAASYVALDVAGRIWRTTGRMRAAWIAAAAVAMGGGIWAMHFIGMLAFGLPMPISYDAGLTMTSLALAIGATGISFSLMAGAASWQRLVPAGLIMGLGVVVMHYSGMEAMQLAATLTYEPWPFALSIVIAIGASTAALWLSTRVVNALWQLGAALLMGAAVCGMHYVGMDAACFSSAPEALNAGKPGFDPGSLAVLVAFGTLVILLLAFVSSIVDRRLTGFRLREAQLAELSAQRLKGLIQATNDLILVVDPMHRIDFVGPSAQEAIGRSVESLAGTRLAALIGEAAAQELNEVMADLAPDARADLRRPVHLALPDGTARIFDVSVTNLLAQPAVGGTVMTFHDVTLRQQAADELQAAMELADQMNRMKTQFMANMSHELRTPLNAVIGLSELIAMEIDGPIGSPLYVEYVDDIKRSGLHLLAVIEDVLAMARLDADEVELRESISDALALATEASRGIARDAAEKHVAVTVTVEDRRELRCDRDKVVQILTKLLSNAVKFTRENGKVVLAGRIVGDGYAFTVEDDGIGIAPEAHDSLFKPFVQADGSLSRSHEGSGLGLPIALGFARLHGGQVEVAPRAEGGTRATLLLPSNRTQAAA